MNWMNELTAEFEKTFIRDDRYKVFVTGFKNTILITLVSLCVGLIAGILHRHRPVRIPADETKSSRDLVCEALVCHLLGGR